MAQIIAELRGLSIKTKAVLLILILLLAILLSWMWRWFNPPQPTPRPPQLDGISIGGVVFCDVDKDGNPESSDLGTGEVTVELYSSAATVPQATQDTEYGGVNQGAFHFKDLTAGTYRIQVRETTLPGALTPSYRTSLPSPPAWPNVVVGPSNNQVNFAYALNATSAACPSR